VDAERAEVIAREWGQAVFGSGEYGDVWRYVAALHKDTDHLHAHFVVDMASRKAGSCRSAVMLR
jgi:hypothetical protein